MSECGGSLMRKLSGIDEFPAPLVRERLEKLVHLLLSASLEAGGVEARDEVAIRSEIAEAKGKIRAGETTEVTITRGDASFILGYWSDELNIMCVRRMA